METVRDFILGGSKVTAGSSWSHEIKRCLVFGRKAMTNLDHILKSRGITLPTKVNAFELWCWRRLLRVPWGCKEIQPVHPKGNLSWAFIGRTDAEADTPILSPPDAKNWLLGKDPDAGKDWRWEEKGTAEDEMVGWQHQLDGHEFE